MISGGSVVRRLGSEDDGPARIICSGVLRLYKGRLSRSRSRQWLGMVHSSLVGLRDSWVSVEIGGVGAFVATPMLELV